MRSVHVALAAFSLFAVACSAVPGPDAQPAPSSPSSPSAGRPAGSSSGGSAADPKSPDAGTPSSPAPDPNAFALVATCKQTLCEFYTASDKKRCDDCLAECSNATMSGGFLCDPYKVCKSHCGPTTCTEESKKSCYAFSYKAHLPPGDPAIEAACTRMTSAQITCGTAEVTSEEAASFCRRYSQLEKSSAVTSYACFADAACGADTSSCPPPKGTLGAEICKKVASCGMVCVGDTESNIDQDTNWLRPDVLAAARGCLTQSTCDNAMACVNAFFDALDYSKD